MVAREKPPNHVGSHAAESDHSELHHRLLCRADCSTISVSFPKRAKSAARIDWSSFTVGLAICRSCIGRFENALNGPVQPEVVLGIGLLGRQSLDQRPRKARYDAVIPAQALVALFLGIATRQRNHPHDLGM